MEGAETAAPPPQVPLLLLFWIFLRIGASSFGGGLSGWIYQEIVERRRWLAEADFLGGLALGQIMPGANVVNLSLYVGQRLRGAAGAAAAVLGLIAPPFFIILGLAAAYAHIEGIAWIHWLLEGIAASAVGLTLAMGVKATRRIGRRPASLAVLIATFLAVGVLRWPLIPVVLVMGPLGVALAWARRGGAGDA